MKKHTVTVVVLVILAAAIGYGIGLFDNRPPRVIQAAGSEITLAINQKGQIGNLLITPRAVLQDSRCPVDVRCVQAGTALVSVQLSNWQKTETINLPIGAEPYRFSNEEIVVESVAPERQSGAQIPQGEYKVTLRVREGNP